MKVKDALEDCRNMCEHDVDGRIFHTVDCAFEQNQVEPKESDE